MLVTMDPIPGSFYNIGGTFTLSVKGMLEKLISFEKSDLISTKIDADRLRRLMRICKYLTLVNLRHTQDGSPKSHSTKQCWIC